MLFRSWQSTLTVQLTRQSMGRVATSDTLVNAESTLTQRGYAWAASAERVLARDGGGAGLRRRVWWRRNRLNQTMELVVVPAARDGGGRRRSLQKGAAARVACVGLL